MRMACANLAAMLRAFAPCTIAIGGFVAGAATLSMAPVMAQGTGSVEPPAVERTDTASWTTADDHRNMQQQLGIRALRPGPTADAAGAERRELRRSARESASEPARSVDAEKRREGHDSRRVVERAPRRDRRGLRARGRRARAARCAGRRMVRRRDARVGDRREARRRPPARRQRRQLRVSRDRCRDLHDARDAGRRASRARHDHVRRRRSAAEAIAAGCAAGRVPPGRAAAAAAGRAPAGRSDPPATEQLIAAGWGFASLRPTSVQADNGAGLTRGIIGLVNKGQPRKPDDWGALRAWAWGASRGLDYLETTSAVDAKRVGIEGVSRYGKAALVAMAFDPRFAVVLVGSSGEGGAKLHRRNFGEAVENLTGQRRVPLDGRQLPEVRRGGSRRSAAGTPATCRSTRTS